MKLVTLDKDNSIQVKDPVQYFLDPDFIYIPLPDKKEKLKKEKNWKKGSLLYDNLYSPVSGKLVNITKCLLPNGKNVNCLVLANDFQEKSGKKVATRKKINNLSKEEFLESIFDSTLKNRFQKQEEVSTIVISGMDDEPYMANESSIGRNHAKFILETVDALLHLYPNSKAFIVLKNTDNESIIAYNSFLGTYKNIILKMVPDLYLIGKEKFLVPYLHMRKNYVYLKGSEVFSLYINLKKRIPALEKYITITGNAIDKPQVIRTKYGVKILDILNRFYKEDFSGASFYVNGVLQGRELAIQDVLVTFDFEGLAIMKKEEKKEKTCIKCGKCIAICPIRSNPLVAYKTGKKVRCIECGLCSYICPSYIPLQNYLSGEEK